MEHPYKFRHTKLLKLLDDPLLLVGKKVMPVVGSDKNLYKLIDSTVVKIVMSIALLMEV